MSRERDLPEADPHANEPEDMSPEGVSRRKLLKLGVGALGCGLAVVPIVPALGYLVHPLRMRPDEKDAMLTIDKRSTFKTIPIQVDLYTDRHDT